MIFGRSDGPTTIKNNLFFNGIVKFAFLLQVGPREQKSDVFGPQSGQKSSPEGDKIRFKIMTKIEVEKMKVQNRKNRVPGRPKYL